MRFVEVITTSETEAWLRLSAARIERAAREITGVAKVTPRAWRRVSYSTSGENCVEVTALAPELKDQDFNRASWMKRTHSQQTTDQCVELASVSSYAAVRDSRDPEGPKLVLEGRAWQELRRQIKAGAFDQG